MALKVLKQQAETPVQSGKNRPFPKGIWLFEIMTPTGERTRPTPDFMHNAADTEQMNASLPEDKQKLPRVSGEDGEILSVWLGNAEPCWHSQDNPGKQIFFQDIVIRDGEVEISELDVDAPNGAGWQIQRDARLLANLAIALGATTEVSEGDQTYVEVAPNFVELLRSGVFDGQKVVAEVNHRAWKSQSGKSGIEASISRFTPAV